MRSPQNFIDMMRKDSTMSHKTVDCSTQASSESEFDHVPQTGASSVNKPFNPYNNVKTGRAISSPFSTTQDFVLASSRHALHPAATSGGSPPTSQAGKAGHGSPEFGLKSPTGNPKSYTLSLHEGDAFSNEMDSCSRFAILGNIPERWATTDILENVVITVGIDSLILSRHVVRVGDGLVDLHLYFNDIRDVPMSQEKFRRALPEVTFKLINHVEYFSKHAKHPRALSTTAFTGQIDFETQYVGNIIDFSLETIISTIREYAAKFGEIRTFALQSPCKCTSPRFRVEYFCINDAASACEPGDIKEFIEIDDLVITIQEYSHENSAAMQQDSSSPSPMAQCAFASLQAREKMTSVASELRNHPHNKEPALDNRSSEVRRVGNVLREMINHEIVNASGPGDIYGQPQMVILKNIIHGVDCRTTVMVRNIPNKMDAISLKHWLDVTSHGCYDFSYLRVDFSNNCNVGYAFVNFSKPSHIVDFVQKRVSKPWNMYGSEKTCEVSYATIQGQDCLVAKFRNSSVMQEWEGFRPQVFYSADDQHIPNDKKPGDPAPFPGPNNLSKLQRSLDNAQAVGLYPPRGNQRGRDQNPNPRRSNNYDRGTPRAILEERAQSGHMPESSGVPAYFTNQFGHYATAMSPTPLVVYLNNNHRPHVHRGNQGQRGQGPQMNPGFPQFGQFTPTQWGQFGQVDQFGQQFVGGFVGQPSNTHRGQTNFVNQNGIRGRNNHNNNNNNNNGQGRRRGGNNAY